MALQYLKKTPSSAQARFSEYIRQQARDIASVVDAAMILGIDRSAKMVAAATKRNTGFVSAGLANFVLATLETYAPGHQRFDKVLAMRVRIFHDKPAEARRLIEGWLAPNGRLFVEYDAPGQYIQDVPYR